jgi:hypothetical protein
MNKKNIFRFILIGAFIAFISSCAKDDTTIGTDKYVGQWTCKEAQGSVSTTFTINIQKHGSEDTLDVYNFDNLGTNEKAIFIINENSIVIPSQTVSNFSVSGYGTYTSGKLNLNYTVDTDSYTAVCSQ